MAISESIRVALDGVNDSSAEFDSLLRAFEALQREDLLDSPFIYVFRNHFRRYSQQCNDLETILRRQVLPVLEDFENVRASK